MILNKNKLKKLNLRNKTLIEKKTIIIECNKCPNYKGENFYNHECISCIASTLFKHKKKQISKIILKSYDYKLETENIHFFLEYFSHLQELNILLVNIKKIRKNCRYSDFKCKFLDNSLLNLNEKIIFYNPILFYSIIKKHHLKMVNNKIGHTCEKCINKIKPNIKKIIKILNSLQIIKKFEDFNGKSELYNNFSNFYDFIFSNIILNQKKKIRSTNIHKKGLIENYSISKNNVYKIFIFDIENEREKHYSLKKFYQETPDEDYFERIITFIANKIKLIKIDKVISLENLIESYKFKAIKALDQKFELKDSNKSRIGLLIALKVLKLEKIFPLLIDHHIEEIFLDSPLDYIYLNHQKHGRCRTHINFSKSEIERIITMLRLYSGRRLDHSNPNLKMILKNKFFYCRFAIDIAPINFNEFSMDIRKLNKNLFTIQDLIKNNTLTPKMAAFLYFCILKRKNFTVTGKTDSGKTTLINALDLLTPKEFRKIYVENVVESLNEIPFDKHQLKFKVESQTSNKNLNVFTKSNQIKTLLHRTPDNIFLGEILTKEDSEAMFHCLAAGLKGFQTIHANNINSLINRFLYHFNINKSCLNDLDLIILMRKTPNFNRQVHSINEIFLNEKEKVVIQPLFQYNPKLKKHELLTPLYQSRILKNICKFEYLPQDDFQFLIKLYQKIFKLLFSNDKINNNRLIDFFHTLSYLSSTSFENLREYFNNYKEKLF